MAFHHVAITTRDPEASHRFYTEAMGFALVKVEAAPTEGGFAKHLFYDTGGGGMLALWDLHDETIPADFKTDLTSGAGLPIWTNHIAFHSDDLEDLEKRKLRWLEHGHEVMHIDHVWCQSIYTRDPSGILVEFCTTTRAFTKDDASEAEALLRDPSPALATPPKPRLFKP